MQHFSWHWIKCQSAKDSRAKMLMSLADDLNFHPNGWSGKGKIYEWLDTVFADSYFYVFVRELEVVFLNRKSMPKRKLFAGSR